MPIDGAAELSKISGLRREEILNIWGAVKANQAKLDSCKRHQFKGGEVKKLGQKFICANCGGEVGLTDIGWYIRGYEASGGSADDIWPGFRSENKRAD